METPHIADDEAKQRVWDLVMSGTPQTIIAEIMGICMETLKKHYRYQLDNAKSEAIERIAKTVYSQAVCGNEKSQALYLKTQGASHGWVEKQVIETTATDDIKELKDSVKALEDKYQKDY